TGGSFSKLIRTLASLVTSAVRLAQLRRAASSAQEDSDSASALEIVQTGDDRLTNRFFPYDQIETDAVLSLLDDDVDVLVPSEVLLAYHVWLENPDRLVGLGADSSSGGQQPSVSPLLSGTLAMNCMVANLTGRGAVKIGQPSLKSVAAGPGRDRTALAADCLSEIGRYLGSVGLESPRRVWMAFKADPVLYGTAYANWTANADFLGSTVSRDLIIDAFCFLVPNLQPASMPACGSRAARLQQAFFPDVASADAHNHRASCVNRLSAPRRLPWQSPVDNRAAHGAAALAALLSRKQACRLAFIDQPDLLAALLARLDCRYDDSSSSGERGEASAPALLLSAITDPQSLSHSLTLLPSPAAASVPEARRSARPGLPLAGRLAGPCRSPPAGAGRSKPRLAGLLAPSSPIFAKRPRDENLLVARGCRRLLRVRLTPNGKSAVIRARLFRSSGRRRLCCQARRRLRLLLSCLWRACANLSNCCCFEGSLAPHHPICSSRLTGLLTSPDADTATCAAGLLCNLTCGSRPCKRAVVQAGGSAALTVALLSIRQARTKRPRNSSTARRLKRAALPVESSSKISNALLMACRQPGLCRNLVALADRWRRCPRQWWNCRIGRRSDPAANDADEYDACGRRCCRVAAIRSGRRHQCRRDSGGRLAFLAALSDAASAAAAAAKPEFLAALASLIRSRRSAVAAGAVELLDKLRLSASTTASPSLGSVSSRGSRPLLQPAALIGGWEYC
uniref:Glyco_transf_64 domain-containing protein n=1 Tax=Macrostomum lignano TaxID=282301 RepID=A0A1I8FAL1_9PLAT